MAKIGFIGLGHMGLPMAINLVAAGHQVTGYDLQSSAVEQFAQEGGLAARYLHDAAKEQDYVITMLQTGQQVMHVCLNIDGIFPKMKKGALFIDCSSIDVSTTRKIHQQAQEHQLACVDAPVSGGVVAAETATLTFIVGGDEQEYQAARPILACMGQKIIYTGLSGSGQAAKICNNMILGISMVGISEAFLLAEQFGLSARKFFDVVSNSSGQCWALTQYVPVPGILDNVPANHDYAPGFTATMMLKDLLLSQATAHQNKLETPLTDKTAELYQQFINQGFGNKDFSGIIELLAKEKE